MKISRLILILCFSQPVFGQFNNPSGIWEVSYMQKADELFEQNFFEEAITYYRKELEKYNFNEKVIEKLAICYWKLANYKMVRNYYTIMMQTSQIKIPSDMFYYAESLLSNGEIDDAIIWYNKYLDTIRNDQIATNRLQGALNIDQFYQDSTFKIVNPSHVNSERTEFGAIPFLDGIAFTSAREKDIIINYDHLRESESLLDMYYLPRYNTDSGTAEPERIRLSDHRKSNDGPMTIGENLIVLNRNNGKKKEEVYNAMGLQFFEYHEDKLSYLYPYPYNDHSYSILHPTLSKGEDTLYFASDMPGGFGGMDIFYSVFVGETWTPPVNMGAPVNTKADEVYPFIDGSKFYFSSNGHPGLGGLDIYYYDLNGGKSGEVMNMGYPINSGWDDFSFYVRKNQGYLASNRPGGMGLDDIYEVIILEIPEKAIAKTTLKLDIRDLLNDEVIEFADIKLQEEESGMEYKFLADQNGDLSQLLPSSKYKMQVLKNGYEDYGVQIDLTNNPLYVDEIFLNPVLMVENMKSDSILFELDEFRLTKGAKSELKQVVDIMKKYESIGLEIGAHTDSRGDADYNFWLSEMRAASAANYLIEEGIPFERIKITGYGESQLLNDCKDGVPCTAQQHQVNRRIEFKLTTTNK